MNVTELVSETLALVTVEHKSKLQSTSVKTALTYCSRLLDKESDLQENIHIVGLARVKTLSTLFCS